MDISHVPAYEPLEEKKVGERIYKTSIEGLFYISTTVFPDERGSYREVSIIPDLQGVLPFEFIIKQINHSRSNKNVLRGIHAESWNKLITVTSGMCLCVYTDLRPDSNTFLQKEYVFLGPEEQALPGSVFVTQGIGNSFLVLNGPSDYIYAVDALYRERDKSGDFAISAYDPDLSIVWPIEKDQVIISERDKNSISIREKFPDKF